MKTPRLFRHLLFVIILLSMSLNPVVAYAESQNKLILNVIDSDERETTLELSIDGFQTETFVQDGYTYQRIVIEKTVQSMDIAQPQVPVFSTMIGVTNPEDISLQVIEKQSETHQGYNLPFVREISTQGANLLNQQAAVQVVTSSTSAVEASGKILPGNLVEISQSGYLRDQGFMQITFYPVQFDSEHQAVIFYKHIVVKVTYNSENSVENKTNRGNRPEFESALSNTLVNYSNLVRPKAMTLESSLSGVQNQSQSLDVLNPSLKVATSQEGLYQLTYEDMINSGLDPTSVDSSTIKLTNRGPEVAILIQDGGDGKINAPGERILFFGEAVNDVYTNKNVYWLTYGPGAGKRMIGINEVPGSPADIAQTSNPPHFYPDAVYRMYLPFSTRDFVMRKEFQTLSHAEQDTFYWQTMPEGAGQDHWFWGDRLSPNTQGLPTSRTYTVSLNNISNTAGLTANIHFSLKGFTDIPYIVPDHHTRVYINDHLVNDWNWNGQAILDVNQDISQASYLVEGNNSVRFEAIEIPGIILDQILVNWIEITYSSKYQVLNNQLYFHSPSDGGHMFHIKGFTDPSISVFDVTDPTNAAYFNNLNIFQQGSTTTVEFWDTALISDRYLAISNSQFLTPASIELDVLSSWKTPEHGADYIIITYDGFYNNILPLAGFRSGTGMRVEVVKVQDLYDEFNYGIFNPSAIRDFLIYAYQNWQPPAPLYMLLVGDAIIDYKDNYHTNSVNYVPTQIVETVALGETPTDNWFVQISGNDILPDMYLGRLSAQTSSQVDTIVQKIINYEQVEAPYTWPTDAIFVADDDDPSWETDSDAFAALLPGGSTFQKIYAGNYAPPGNPTQDFIDFVNSGTMMANYLGHGDVGRWGIWGSGSYLLDLDSVNLMNNVDKHTFITIESCLNGFFPGFQSNYSLGEALHRLDTGGAVAVWAPSGLSYANGHVYMISELYEAFFVSNIYKLGIATYQAKLNVYDLSSAWGDLVNTYILFGDPATTLGVVP